MATQMTMISTSWSIAVTSILLFLSVNLPSEKRYQERFVYVFHLVYDRVLVRSILKNRYEILS